MSHIRTPFLQLYRINSLRLIGAGAALVLPFTAPPPAHPVADIVLEGLGTLAIFLALAGRAWTLFYIGGRKNSELVTAGPYSMTRNPLYLFSLLGVIGVAAQTGSLLALILIAAAAYFAFDMAMRGEEAYLAGRYGLLFQDYRLSTPRLWPDTALWRESADQPLRSAHAIASLKDGAVFLSAWFGIEGIQLAQSAGLVPVIWTLPI